MWPSQTKLYVSICRLQNPPEMEMSTPGERKAEAICLASFFVGDSNAFIKIGWPDKCNSCKCLRLVSSVLNTPQWFCFKSTAIKWISVYEVRRGLNICTSDLMSQEPHSIISLKKKHQQAAAISGSYLFLWQVGMRLFSVAGPALVLWAWLIDRMVQGELGLWDSSADSR